VARAERLARLRGQVEAARATAAAAEEEAGRLAEAFAQARARAEHAQQQYGQVQDLVSGRDEGRSDLAAAHERAKAALAEAAAKVAAQRTAEHAASDRRAALGARTEALEEAVKRGADGSGVLLAGQDRFGGVVGAFAAMLTVEDGAADAIAAALGASATAVAVSGLDEAAAILAALKAEDGGRADLVIAAGRPNGDGEAARTGRAARAAVAVPPGVRRALDLVKAPGEFALAVEELLAGVAVVTDLAEGIGLLRAHPQLRVVTADGDLIGAHWARGGSAGAPSLIGMRVAAQEAAEALREAESKCQRAERDLADAADEEDRARQVAAAALARLQETDAEAAEISGRLGTLAGAARAASDEAGRLAAGIATAERARENDRARLAELERALGVAEADADAARAAQDVPAVAAGETRADRERLVELAVATRNAEMDARLDVRTVEERLRAITGRADSLAAAATAERQARQRAEARRIRRESEAALASAVAAGAAYAVARIEQSLSVADADRQAAELASKGRDDQLKAVRGQIRELSGELDQVVDSAHGAEIARAARRMQLDQIATRAVDEFAVDAEALTAEYGPGVLIPQADESHPPLPYDRAAQERRAQAARRLLDQLGKVNPLALEEFAALEERHAFLVTQLEDLKNTRRDLLTVIKEVDDRVLQVFAAAYEDTAREFEHIFGTLFPGGEGRLVLTEPDDMLVTGIDFEARPPGKKVKRLSLLSGGERALTAIAFLVAIFKARPSPFYVLDEVEAALDDSNLQRLLHIFEELRESSQLIIVTHQKRTMEVADSLYGISMRGDGVSTVVSQRLRERETA
jgi:chromosome segregation protein